MNNLKLKWFDFWHNWNHELDRHLRLKKLVLGKQLEPLIVILLIGIHLRQVKARRLRYFIIQI